MNFQTVLAEALEKQEDIVFAYLFGSFAKEKTHSQSDLDIAVYLKGDFKKDFKERKLELIGLILEITRANQIDLLILNETSPLVIHSVLKTGKLLFSKDEEERIGFIVKNLNEYLDLYFQLKICWSAMRKRIKENHFGF
ncbi:MAG: nucleotidyltransferase domain-containing protein [Thermodesulfobacteriaceae bacterium]|nr:nucleotidyltransferase domain-containing protein [Thermodesulfobacteriaceae bacterium]MCX8042109.1 nucleotidyltransferase domain-containing protein [Thermodesulfobacteriaceae bacterium]MDW8136205.1 nucleotidyltransferase domain-containing protein [Thermodesulfobacterium sp.]